MKQNEFKRLEVINRKVMDENLKGGSYRTYFILENIDLINNAFIDEVGFSFNEFKEFICAMIVLNN